ncbi:VOC family protein [Pseudomonas sp. 13B_2.1_Bac1]|uniref:VOC family protein n=1 Tax=Pseudomonas sp. 13B_2.1_Bac1 TaxID=2971624 RepID=UPI0021CA616F|nr:VOC family protein [Pseudomonas sp. 13B_2.1_Bac1]MCU1785208.1 VOC family protein [Pseudomonas sp. 13B_2.1_Bac1]
MKLNPHIQRHHHITLNVGGAQEDYDFHTKVLGLKSVKKTGLYDGEDPIYHLYYGNDLGEESTLITCFPFRQSGRKARQGSGQIKTLALSVPESSLVFWAKHLENHGFKPEFQERFGEKLLHFAHPCGICYELVGIADDDRKPYSNGVVPEGFGIRGTHGITVSVRDLENSSEFMHYGWSGSLKNTDGIYSRYEVGKGGSGTIIDFELDADLPQGSWAYGEGVVHHCAFEVSGLDVQRDVKLHLEGLGYTDVSDRKDRGYFDSVYVRTPGGALFEATVSKPKGFLVDETYEDLGKTIQVPPQMAARAEEIAAYLEPLKY